MKSTSYTRGNIPPKNGCNVRTACLVRSPRSVARFPGQVRSFLPPPVERLIFSFILIQCFRHDAHLWRLDCGLKVFKLTLWFRTGREAADAELFVATGVLPVIMMCRHMSGSCRRKLYFGFMHNVHVELHVHLYVVHRLATF